MRTHVDEIDRRCCINSNFLQVGIAKRQAPYVDWAYRSPKQLTLSHQEPVMPKIVDGALGLCLAPASNRGVSQVHPGVDGGVDLRVPDHTTLCRRKWKRTSGYHRRSVVETQLCRYKQLTGRQLRARSQENQETEARLGCAVLNRMMRIAKPVSYPIERRA